ncbi:MAG: O-antigen ligase family protein [Armatimonadetes bacterium]|nr:O-antigen ligase family protein [Armatimonadota bacterium]
MSLQLETVPERQEQRRVSLIGLGAACAISAGAGMLLLMGAPFLVLAVLVGVAAAIAAVWTSIKNPYHGLMIYIFLEYSRMSEVVPAVARFYPARIIAVCALIGWVASTCRSRARIVWSGQTWLMTGLVMSMAISSITAIWASHAIQVTTDVAKTLVVFIIITNVIDSREKLRGMAWLLVSAGFVLGAYSIIGYMRTGQPSAGWGTGFLADQNDSALAMVSLTPLAIALFQMSKGLIRRALSAIGLASIPGGVVCTFSRGGFGGLLLVLFTMSMLSKRRMTTLAVLAALVVGSWLFAPEAYHDRITSISSYRDDDSMKGRSYAWRSATMMFRDRPFFGVGPGNFKLAYGLQYKVAVEIGKWIEAHSIYFQCLGDLGLFGCIFFFGLIFMTYRDLLRIYRRGGRDPDLFWERKMAAGIGVGLLGYLACGALLSALYYSYAYYYAAMAVCMTRYTRRA